MSQRYRKANKMAEEMQTTVPTDEIPPAHIEGMRPMLVLYASKDQQSFHWWVSPALTAFCWSAALIQLQGMLTAWLMPKPKPQQQVEVAPGAMLGYLNKRIGRG